MATGTVHHKHPWEMTQAEWLQTKPKVTRHFHLYDSITRANLASSHRLGYRQRQAVGEFFYTNPVDNIAYPSAKAAKIGWHRAIIQLALAQGRHVPANVRAEYPDLV